MAATPSTRNPNTGKGKSCLLFGTSTGSAQLPTQKRGIYGHINHQRKTSRNKRGCLAPDLTEGSISDQHFAIESSYASYGPS